MNISPYDCDSDSLLAAVFSIVRDFYGLKNETGLSVEGIVPNFCSANPLIEYELKKNGKTITKLIFKYHDPGRNAKDTLEHEYQMLLGLSTRKELIEQQIQVPRPVAQLPNFNGLLMEKVMGQRLSDYLRRNNRLFSKKSHKTIEEILQRCGYGLKCIHTHIDTHYDVEKVKAFFFDFQKKTLEATTFLKERGYLYDIEEQRIKTLIMKTADVNASELLIVRKHGDFLPANMLYDGTTLTLLDFAFSRDGLIHHDLAWLLLALEILNPYPSQPLYDFCQIKRYQRAFLIGYFGEITKISATDYFLISLFKTQALLFHFNRRVLKHENKSMLKSAYLNAMAIIYRKLLNSELLQAESL